MANIVFRIPQKLYILSDFTKETLDKISHKTLKIIYKKLAQLKIKLYICRRN